MQPAVTAVPTTTAGTTNDTGLLEISRFDRYSLHQTVADYAREHLTDSSASQRLISYITSFVETHRHLVMATDCWLRRMVKGMERPFHPWGVSGSWLRDPASFRYRAFFQRFSRSAQGRSWPRGGTT